jgi:hypothetical protein
MSDPGDRRYERLESGQRETNERLGRIGATLETSSRLFELMHTRLEHLEEGQTALVEGQKLVVERLDRLVEAATRERTDLVERLGAVERRLDAIDQRIGPSRT